MKHYIMEKTLAIIDNFEIENEKFYSRFNTLLQSIQPSVHWEFIHYSQLSTPKEYNTVLGYDGLLLTGSYQSLSNPEIIEKYAKEQQLIRDFHKPILGICFGHQLIGTTFGFQVQRMTHPDPDIEDEKTLELSIEPSFELFPRKKITVYETHHQEIKNTPEFAQVFQNYASSPTCQLQMIKHRELPIYALQFHPENPTNPTAFEDGKILMANFVKIL
ncbi:MAG: gamma-glutamyl-gamma-aminobutyrate hydrolase family protein [Candidatus Heimdallarchaeota archaeon]|nr:gamma-glutamyl-gamma-aminobutyrate hydrolase family protein [Candidatus Heimdallarchaeota archaeon]